MLNSIIKILEAYEAESYKNFDGDRDEAIDFIIDAATSLPNYVNVVVKEQIIFPTLRFRYEGEEYRSMVQSLDRKRKSSHDAAISNINRLNRQCSVYGIKPFADVNTNDRKAVANFAGRFTNALFNQGQGNVLYEEFDNAVAYGETKGGYDTKQVRTQIMSAYEGGDNNE